MSSAYHESQIPQSYVYLGTDTKQESIPVGYLPPAFVVRGRVGLGIWGWGWRWEVGYGGAYLLPGYPTPARNMGPEVP